VDQYVGVNPVLGLFHCVDVSDVAEVLEIARTSKSLATLLKFTRCNNPRTGLTSVNNQRVNLKSVTNQCNVLLLLLLLLLFNGAPANVGPRPPLMRFRNLTLIDNWQCHI
jgi:hypothetical protein